MITYLSITIPLVDESFIWYFVIAELAFALIVRPNWLRPIPIAITGVGWLLFILFSRNLFAFPTAICCVLGMFPAWFLGWLVRALMERRRD